MKFANKKTRRIFREIKVAVFQLAIYLLMILLAVFAVCFILSIPEIIGLLIFG